MSVESEINRIKTNIANAYSSLGDKGATLPSVQDSANLASTVITVPSGGGVVIVPEKDVNFYDYDGTVIASYTASEFANLSAMPDNPSHDGLTAQGWNWTLSDAKTYVAEYGKLNIGQIYITDDGKTRIYITLQERLDPYLGFATNGTVTIEWGDGNSQTVTGSSTNTVIYTQHIYSEPGDYVIKLSIPQSSPQKYIGLRGSSKGGDLITKNSNTGENRVYINSVKKIEFGNYVSIYNQAFYNYAALKNVVITKDINCSASNAFSYCYSLENLVFPKKTTDIGGSFCVDCYSLKKVVMPKELTFISSNAFQNCRLLKGITLSSDITSFSTYTFDSCYSLQEIKIPKNINALPLGLFTYCQGMKKYDFTNHTSVPSLNSSTFSSFPSDCRIVVPDNLYENWIAASNWSTYASYIVKASQYSG